MYYTEGDRAEDGECLYDQVSIDIANRRYVLDRGVCLLALDGVDENDEPVDSCDVSRVVFDSILEGLARRGFARVEWETSEDEDEDEADT